MHSRLHATFRSKPLLLYRCIIRAPPRMLQRRARWSPELAEMNLQLLQRLITRHILHGIACLPLRYAHIGAQLKVFARRAATAAVVAGVPS